MAFTIASSVGASMAAATGRPCQGHVQWAVNQGAYWVFYLTGTQGLSAVYSTNGGSSWTTPTLANPGGMPIAGSSFTLPSAHGSEGRSFGAGYANLSSTDVLHLSFVSNEQRFTLGTTWTNTHYDTLTDATTRIGDAMALDSTGLPILDTANTGASASVYRATNADSGTSWTAGWGSYVGYYNVGPWCSSFGVVPCGTGDAIVLADNGASASTFSNLEWVHWTGSAWSAASTVFGSALTAADTNAWGACGRTTSDVHALALSDNSANYSHARFNGSSWSAGDTVPTLAYGTDSGISLVSDGTSVWAAVIDTSNNIKYCKWASGTGWGSWTVLEATRANTPACITGVYSPANQQIMWAWTESTGSNYNIVGSVLGTGGVAGGRKPYPAVIAQEFPPLAAEEW